jgi:hypothetical protein
VSPHLHAAALLLALGADAQAQSAYPSLGRLFTTPTERLHLDRQRFTGPAPGSAAAAAPAPAPPPVASTVPPPPPAPVTLTGVVRRSNGDATVLIGDETRELRMKPGATGATVPVEVGGREVLLKPGQSIDPANGTIQDVR